MSVHSSSLGESLRAEQRRRWARGDRVLVESYLESHPELSQNAAVLLELIETEYQLRVESGETPSVDEYERRFPNLSGEISRRLAKTSQRSPSAATRDSSPALRTVPCPFCQAEVELTTAGGDGDSATQCSHCGHKIHILDETVSLRAKPGRRIGAFELVRRVGGGQFGEVWLARDSNLRRDVAIKLPKHDSDDDSANALFLREARAVAQLRHPNIVAVHEVALDDGSPYIVSDFIQGITLRERIAQRRFKPAEAARLCQILAEAVQHAHEAGIVHRDLKPGNVLLDLQGAPHIADFGLARHASLNELTITTEGKIVGTPGYMPPEQARGEASQVGPASDVYSLGVMLYELLTGQRPFDGSFEALLYRILSEEPTPPRKIAPGVPIDLETICLKAMAKKPADRYASAQDLAADLGRFLQGEPIAARRATWLERSARWTRRHALKLAAGGTIAAAGVAFGAWYRSGPSLPAAPTLRVRIKTIPEGAQVAFIPLNDKRQPLPDQIVRATAGPEAQLELLPGDYLVVADKPDHGFHEVWRRVPEDPRATPNAFRYARWRAVDDRTVELPEITIPTTAEATKGMALLEGGRFNMGRAGVPNLPLHLREVPAFYLDTAEMTLGEYRRIFKTIPSQLKADPPPDGHPVSYVSWEEAVYVAEMAGKRLVEEAEYEFAATNRGTTPYPWGLALRDENEPWVFGPVGVDPLDESAAEPPIKGLCSNVAEWTATRMVVYPGLEHLPLGIEVRDLYVVRGGTAEVLKGNALSGQWAELPQLRLETPRQTWAPGLGFRCARSARPRLRAEDFVRVVEE